MSTLTLNLLGPPRFVRDGEPRALVQAKGVALLVYLAVTREAQPRDQLVDLLWPESLPQAARKNMRNVLWAIGETLGDGLIEQHGTTIGLAPSVVVDIHTLEDGLLLLESGTVAALERAVAVYGGDLAENLALREAAEFEIWLATERERLKAVFLRLETRLINLHRAAGNWPAVLAHAFSAIAADPLNELLYLAAIEAYVQSAHRELAVRQYAKMTELLRRELATDPLPETTVRYELLLANVASDANRATSSPNRSEAPIIFVGREAERAALDAELVRACLGEARVVMITGDLGMGKSQLWRTWADTHAADATMLATHALETSEPVPFGPVLALFRQPSAARQLIQPPSPLAPIWLAELARLLPEINSTWPNLPPPLALSPAEGRARLFQALAETVQLLAQRPLVLVIDDLHWADPSTLDWLVYLIDHLRNAPLLLIGTYRMQDAPERLRSVVAGWLRQGHGHTIDLSPLDENQAQALLQSRGEANEPRLLANWVQQSGGNPYFLIELQRARNSDAAHDLAALIRTRLQATVPTNALQVLQATAILGDDALFETIRLASGRSHEETLDGLDALVAATVLVSQDRSYRFVHPFVATVVRGNLSPARRAFLHGRAAQAVEQVYAPTPERAAAALMEHYAAAGDVKQAAYYAEHATIQALAVGAALEAATYARSAVSWEPTPQRQALLGEAQMRSGAVREGQLQLEVAWHSFAQIDDAVGMTRIGILLGIMAIGASQPDLARSWLARTPIAQTQMLEPELGVQAHLLVASANRQTQAYDAAAIQLDAAAALAQANRLSRLAAGIAFERGNLLSDRGDRAAALASFKAALQHAQASENPLDMALVHNNLAYHLLQAGDLVGAQTNIQAATQLTERYALNFLQQYVYSTTGEIALAQHQLDHADTAFTHAFEAAQVWNNRTHMANIRVNQALAAHNRGDQAHAHRLLNEARDFFDGAADPFVRDKIARVTAEIMPIP